MLVNYKNNRYCSLLLFLTQLRCISLAPDSNVALRIQIQAPVAESHGWIHQGARPGLLQLQRDKPPQKLHDGRSGFFVSSYKIYRGIQWHSHLPVDP